MENPHTTYVRNFILGVEDSLVSTVGLLSGIAVAGTETNTIILAGIVLIFVEAFSMGTGSLLSEHSAQQIDLHKEVSFKKSLKSGGVMFVSYFIAGFIPLAPYILLSAPYALPTSIVLSLSALLLLGASSGEMAGIRITRPALQMFFIGGVAVLLGAFVGMIFT